MQLHRPSIVLRTALFFFFFLFHFQVACFSVETSAIDLKLQHNIDTGPSSNRNAFLKIWPMVTKLDPLEMLQHATHVFDRNGVISLKLQWGCANFSYIGAVRRRTYSVQHWTIIRLEMQWYHLNAQGISNQVKLQLHDSLCTHSDKAHEVASDVSNRTAAYLMEHIRKFRSWLCLLRFRLASY